MELLDILTFSQPIIDFIKSHSEALVTATGIYIAFKQSSKDKRVETYLKLKETYRTMWGQVTAHPSDNHELLQRAIYEIDSKEEMLKLSIYQILDLFNDVFFYYRKTGEKFDKSDWQHTIDYTLSSPLFITAFEKHKDAFNKEFLKYVVQQLNAGKYIIPTKEK
jgi:hypothetical protein